MSTNSVKLQALLAVLGAYTSEDIPDDLCEAFAKSVQANLFIDLSAFTDLNYTDTAADQAGSPGVDGAYSKFSDWLHRIEAEAEAVAALRRHHGGEH